MYFLSEWSGNEYSLLLSDLQREKENLEKRQSEPKIRPFSSSKLHTRRSSKKLKSAHSTPNVNTYLRKNTSTGTISEGMPSGYNDFMRKKVALSVAVQVQSDNNKSLLMTSLIKTFILSRKIYIMLEKKLQKAL